LQGKFPVSENLKAHGNNPIKNSFSRLFKRYSIVHYSFSKNISANEFENMES